MIISERALDFWSFLLRFDCNLKVIWCKFCQTSHPFNESWSFNDSFSTIGFCAIWYRSLRFQPWNLSTSNLPTSNIKRFKSVFIFHGFPPLQAPKLLWKDHRIRPRPPWVVNNGCCERDKPGLRYSGSFITTWRHFQIKRMTRSSTENFSWWTTLFLFTSQPALARV